MKRKDTEEQKKAVLHALDYDSFLKDLHLIT